MGKRKRRVENTRLEYPNKVRVATAERAREVKHAVLSPYYLRILTLRDFLLSRLPVSSRGRRRKIRDLPGISPAGEAAFLDSILVGVLHDPKPTVEDARRREFLNFTQSPERSPVSLGNTKSAAHIIEVRYFCSATTFALPTT